VTVGHFQFLKTALLTRFPDFKLSGAAPIAGSSAQKIEN
jgi:hypothetical protein